MTVGATEPTGFTQQAQQVQQSASPTDAASKMDKDMFLQLLVAQMRYQDPMNPTDSSQFLAQTAQFTALEKMTDVADQTAQLLSAQLAFGASGLIGRQVSWTDADGATKTGTVDTVTFSATGPLLDVDGTSLPLASVKTVTNPTTPTTPTTPAA